MLPACHEFPADAGCPVSFQMNMLSKWRACQLWMESGLKKTFKF